MGDRVRDPLRRKPVNTVSIVEFDGGKVARENLYFADPFEPPEWRSQWVE
jgi:hypothetical protein